MARSRDTHESADGTARSPRLRDYDAKRDFARTPEPAGGPVEAAGDEAGLRFVVQRHRATRRHYDLRLELDGTLLSWAVPKGPTLDPAARRLAVHVEDHPIEYADFEGVIPAGEYGGGDVIVWDRGTWTPAPDEDPHEAMRDGSLHFDVDAEKLRGRFVLVRKGEAGGKEEWLLLHKNDEHAVEGWDPEDHPRSVLSGRTNEEVAADPDLVWHSDRPADEAAEPMQRARARPAFEPVPEDEVAALDELEDGGTWELQGRSLKVSNLDKELFPPRDDDGAPITKRELLRYHALIAPWMLPYLHDRPVNLHRYPNGAGSKGFWQKAVPDHAPDWLTRWRNEAADEGETECYAVLDSAPSLVWAANLAGFELHPWTSRASDPDRPTWALIDIDPGPATAHADLLLLVRLHRTALEHLGLEAAAKTSGKRGFQIWIPVEPRYSFDDTRAWVEKLSRAVGATVPELVSWAWQKDDREGLARLDYTQNAINKTLVAPFAVRPAPGAPVSMPIGWEELDDPELASDHWTIRTAIDRLEERGDPLAGLIGRPQRLPEL